mgnify:CR=1 FL=1
MNNLYPPPTQPDRRPPTPKQADMRPSPPKRPERRPKLVPVDTALLPPPEAMESVEAFLARGGRIERLDPADRGQPLLRTVKTINDAKAEVRAITAKDAKRRR